MSDIHVTPGDEGPPIYVTEDDGENIIVNSDDTDPNVVVLPGEDPDPDIIFVVDEDEAPDIVHVTEDDIEPIMIGADDVQVIEVNEDGDRGPQGEDGLSAYDVAVKEGFVGTEDQWLASLQGPPGTPGDAPQAYVHDQGIPSLVWFITHGLGYHPNATVIDSGGTEWIGDIDYLSDYELTITFTSAFGGKAYLS